MRVLMKIMTSNCSARAETDIESSDATISEYFWRETSNYLNIKMGAHLGSFGHSQMDIGRICDL